ncbi:hypothetical protein [Streptomyces chartreusis]|uniref:hypothetical protein n=1 Tax=Streptomyces chartreusis TaxID=1969 RepID=UPI003625461D
MLTARDLAEKHSAKSADQFGYLLAFTAGQEAAERGADTEVEVRRLDGPAEIAGYIEGLAAHRARTTKPAAPKPYRLDRRRNTKTKGGRR